MAESKDEGLELRLMMADNLVRETGESFEEHYFNRGNITVTFKPDGSPVTNADKGIEKDIKGVLLEIFKEDSFSGEESKEVIGTSPYRWICDPVDGTWGILSRDGTPSICLALQKDNRTIAAFVYNVERNEYFKATADKRTTLNGKLLPQKPLVEDGLPVCNISLPSYKGHNFDVILDLDEKRKIGKWERKGCSLAYNLAQVAKGPNNCFIAKFTRPCAEYDIVAGRYLVERAGGKVVYDTSKDVIVASTTLQANRLMTGYLNARGFGR